MSITRRQFLLAAPAVTAGLLLPQFADKVLAHVDETGGVLHNRTNEPAYYETVHAWADSDGRYTLSIYDELDMPGRMTHREAAEYLGYDSVEEYVNDYFGYEDDDPFDPDEIADSEIYINEWRRYHCPEARACWHMEDINTDLRQNGEDSLGYIEFIYSNEPRDSYKTAKVPDLESLSLLQQQFNQLNVGIRIEIDN